MKQGYTENNNKVQISEAQARRKRIERYKAWIVRFFLAATIIPSIVSVILICQVNRLEQEVLAISGAEGNDLTTLVSSGEALMSNPNVDMEALTGEEWNTLIEPDGLEPSVLPVGAESEKKRVYLTFDDGPSIYTGQILDILAANDVKATFFVIAREDESYWPYYNRIIEEGHTLGMHSYTHKYNEVYASLEAFETDVDMLSEFLYERTGQRPTIYRFPGGSSNSVTNVPIEECIAYLNEEGITYYDWNALNGDAVTEELSTDKLIDNIMTSVRQNDTSVVLMHDIQSRHNTVESLQGLIDVLKEEGYEILPIDENTPLVQHVPYNTGFQEATD